MIRAIVFDLDDTLYDCLHENDKAVEDTVRYVANELLHIDEVTVMKAFEEGRDMVKDQLSAWDMAAQHNRVLYFQKMLEILGVSPFKYDLQVYNYFWNNFLNKISIFPGALEYESQRNKDWYLYRYDCAYPVQEDRQTWTYGQT